MTTVSKSSTKDQIYAAYLEQSKKLQDAQSAKFDPNAEVTAKKTTQTLEKATASVQDSVAEKIAALQKNVMSVLGGLSSQLTEEIETFTNLQDAIKLKEEELKDLFGIEKEASALAALINTQNDQRAKFSVEHSERVTAANLQLQELNKTTQQAQIDFRNEINTMKAANEIERKREQEEYNYNYKRSKQQAQDTLNDQLADQRRVFNNEVENTQDELNEKVDELEKREAEINSKEDKFDNLEYQVAEFPAQIAQAKVEAAEQTRKDLEKNAAIKDHYVKKDAENQKQIFENKIELLDSALASEKAKVAELTTKLDAAYDKIQNMAMVSVQSANESKSFDKFAAMNANNNSNNNSNK